MHMKHETFGDKLRRLRGAAGLTQMQLAERAGIPLATLRHWEHDRREPLVSALFKLADALGVDCRAFQDGINAGHAEKPAETNKPKRKPRAR